MSLTSALATLQGRWGSAAIRLGSGEVTHPAGERGDAAGLRGSGAGIPAMPGASGLQVGGASGARKDGVTRPAGEGSGVSGLRVVGALALAPAPDAEEQPHLGRERSSGLISTGFPALDAILGPAGLPREASAAIRGDLCSGKTTLALRCVAEAQGQGAIAAWLDLARAFDPLEAVGRGVDLRWLLVIRPGDVPEGFALAGALLSGRALDLLVVDLPPRLSGRLDDPLRRLAAHARRAGARLLVLEPASVASALHGTLAEATGLRLELERRSWLRLDRDVVGQRTEVTVAKNRYGPPGRRAALDIHYLSDGERSIAAHRLVEVLEPAGHQPAALPSARHLAVT